MNHKEWHSHKGYEMSKLYAMSWGMTYFLINFDKGKYHRGFLKYIQLMNTGGGRRDTFEKCVGKKPEELEKEFRKYWKNK